MKKFTTIKDIDQKIDIIDHVNQDHTEELIAIAQTLHQHVNSAKITDIFQEAVQLEVTYSTEQKSEKIVIPFEIEGELEDKILYLAYASIVKQGRDFSGTGKHFFEVLDTQKITENIIRISIKSNTPLPEYYPGYAYAFVLKVMSNRPTEKIPREQKKSWFKNVFDRLFIFLMKHLSTNKRKKLLHSANKGVRLYTLRKSWKSNETSSFCNRGYIDIFKHGNTAGSQWASELRVGDILFSRSEMQDKHPHLITGKILLIADETAFPALAGILEYWQNPIAPQIILLTNSADEQIYFKEKMFPVGSHLSRVVCPADKQSDEVLKIIKKIKHIDGVWAAFESQSAKKVRHFLRNQHQVKGKDNHTKAYWKLKFY